MVKTLKKNLKSKKVIKSKKVKNNNPRGIEKKYKEELKKIAYEFSDLLSKLSNFSVSYDYGEKHISVDYATNSDNVNLSEELNEILTKLYDFLEKDI